MSAHVVIAAVKRALDEGVTFHDILRMVSRMYHDAAHGLRPEIRQPTRDELDDLDAHFATLFPELDVAYLEAAHRAAMHSTAPLEDVLKRRERIRESLTKRASLFDPLHKMLTRLPLAEERYRTKLARLGGIREAAEAHYIGEAETSRRKAAGRAATRESTVLQSTNWSNERDRRLRVIAPYSLPMRSNGRSDEFVELGTPVDGFASMPFTQTSADRARQRRLALAAARAHRRRVANDTQADLLSAAVSRLAVSRHNDE